MLKSSFLMFSFLLFLETQSFADGGSSVAGPGAPEMEYGCYEVEFVFGKPMTAPDFQIDIGKFWPKYELEIDILDYLDFLKGAPEKTQKAVRHEPVTEGAPIVYTSSNYRIEIYVAGPSTVEDGKAFWHGELYRNDVFERELKCRAIHF